MFINCKICNSIIEFFGKVIYCYKCNYIFAYYEDLNPSDWNENLIGIVAKYRLKNRTNYDVEHVFESISLKKYFDICLKMKVFL